MIKVIFFDIYGTLVRFDPPVEILQQHACKVLGLNVTTEGIRKGYQLADEFMAKQNAKLPLSNLSVARKTDFFIEYEKLILQGAGVSVSNDVTSKIWELASSAPKQLALYEDVLPSLERLKGLGIQLGTISNINTNLNQLLAKTNLKSQIDYWLISSETGITKPDPRIFELALQRANIEPHQAIHVGDQYLSDVMGAVRVGIRPVLLDRHDLLPKPSECAKIRSIKELINLL